MAETTSAAQNVAAERTLRTDPTSSFLNLLYENFVEKWNKTITAANYLVKLKTIFDQQPANIHEEIAPNDTMFVPSWREHYFSVGQSAFRCIKAALLAAEKISLKSILDLPCGHGRVMRVLRAAFPDAEITACDLDRDGVDFCAKTFGAVPVYSAEGPAQIPVSGQFDLIWCGSLLTHLDHHLWPGFLDFFSAHLSPGGLLVFTVHGRESVHWIRTGKFDYSIADPRAILTAYDQHGFGYQDYPAHTHQHYGVSLSSPAWVLQQVLKQPDLRLINYTEKGWDNHQDVIACVKS
jgi:SAM-dependent methyltransferase